MVSDIPPKLTRAVRFVKARRSSIPAELTERSRTLVKIRNGTVAIAAGLLLWVPMAVSTYTPWQFLSALPAYAMIWLVTVGVALFVIRRSTAHAKNVLDAVARDQDGMLDPEILDLVLTLEKKPPYMMPFGPWFPVLYAPRFAGKWLKSTKNNLALRR